MTLNYFSNIPNAPDNPSQVSPNMKTNTNSGYTIWTYDHITYGSPTNGQHKWVTFPGQNVPLAPSNPISILYTNGGIGITASTHAELFYRNVDAIFPVNLIKAFANFNANGANGNLIQNLNFNNAFTYSSSFGGTYTLTLNPNIIYSTIPGILIKANATGVNPSYSYAGGIINISNAGTNTYITIIMMEI